MNEKYLKAAEQADLAREAFEMDGTEFDKTITLEGIKVEIYGYGDDTPGVHVYLSQGHGWTEGVHFTDRNVTSREMMTKIIEVNTKKLSEYNEDDVEGMMYILDDIQYMVRKICEATGETIDFLPGMKSRFRAQEYLIVYIGDFVVEIGDWSIHCMDPETTLYKEVFDKITPWDLVQTYDKIEKQYRVNI